MASGSTSSMNVSSRSVAKASKQRLRELRSDFIKEVKVNYVLIANGGYSARAICNPGLLYSS